MQQPKRRSAELSVNSEVDIILILRRIAGWEARARDCHRIRFMQGPGCHVLEELTALARSSRDEYRRLLKGLRLIAQNQELPALHTIKRVGERHQIIQIAGSNSRLYCFMDNDASYTVICVSTLRIGHGSKKKRQNEEIAEAERLRRIWMNAVPVQDAEQDNLPALDREEARSIRMTN